MVRTTSGKVVLYYFANLSMHQLIQALSQGCINRSIIPSGMGARRASSEHVENMELQCALGLGEPCSACLLKESQEQSFSFRHSYLGHFS